jgi:predicted nucleic acid-binding protein
MRRFFDTNVLVYIFDASQPTKQARALQVLTEAINLGLALLSTQVLQEFFVTVTRKLPAPMTEDQAVRAVRDLARLPLVQVDREMILDAIEVTRRYRLILSCCAPRRLVCSVPLRSAWCWDSLIVEAALRGGATILYSEDLQPGQTIKSVTVENPFT